MLVQGITGREGSFQAKEMMDFGTNIVGGVTPGKGGTEVLGIPVYDSVDEAMDKVRPNTSVIFVPPKFAADAIFEAIDSGMELIVCITEGIPVHDMMRVCAYIKTSSSRLLGPNCPGITTPGLRKSGSCQIPFTTPGISQLYQEAVRLLTK